MLLYLSQYNTLTFYLIFKKDNIMGLLCACPQASALAAVPVDACLESIGQVQKVVFQRLNGVSAGTLNSFTIASADPALLASWTPLLTATNNTKAVASPYIQAPVFEAGAEKTYGGGNETLGGVPIVIGREATKFKGNLLRVSQKTIAALKTYQCENIGIFLIDEYGRIVGLADDLADPTKFFPIPLSGLFIGDKTLGGFDSVDMNAINFSLFPNWSDKLYIVTPTDFNPLVELNV